MFGVVALREVVAWIVQSHPLTWVDADTPIAICAPYRMLMGVGLLACIQKR